MREALLDRVEMATTTAESLQMDACIANLEWRHVRRIEAVMSAAFNRPKSDARASEGHGAPPWPMGNAFDRRRDALRSQERLDGLNAKPDRHWTRALHQFRKIPFVVCVDTR